MVLVHIGMQLILDGYTCAWIKGFEEIKSSDLCWKVFPVLVLYFCDIYDEKDVSGVRHVTMVCLLCSRYLIILKSLGVWGSLPFGIYKERRGQGKIR